MAIINTRRCNKINVGKIVNDGLGDDLRTAFQKINGNFDELEEQFEIILQSGAENVGSGAPVFKHKHENKLQFRSLLPGRYTEIEEVGDGIQIGTNVPQPFTRFDTNEGTVLSHNHPEVTFGGGQDIIVKANGPNISIDTRGINGLPFMHILTMYDFGPIDGDFSNPIQLSLASSNIDFGTVEIPGTLHLECGTI